MLSSPYFRHTLYSIACLSISINLVGTRRLTEEDKSRTSARISILESIKEQLTTQDPGTIASKESLERLMKLANRTSNSGSSSFADGDDDNNNNNNQNQKGLGDDVSWSDIFSGKAPRVDRDEMSRWEREDLEKLRKELQS